MHEPKLAETQELMLKYVGEPIPILKADQKAPAPDRSDAIRAIGSIRLPASVGI